MAELVLLSNAATHRSSSPELGRRPGRLLNTIIEEENEDGYHQQKRIAYPDRPGQSNGNANGRRLRPPANMQIEAWLSPMSDHFPTPRGIHYIAAPILPSSPSNDSIEEPLSPTTTSNPWNNRASVTTDITEFDDLYGISDEDEPPLRRGSSRKSSGRRRDSHIPDLPEDAATVARKSLPPLVIPSGRNPTADEWSARSASLKNKLASPVPPTPPTRVEMSPQVFSFMQARQIQEIPALSAAPSLDGSMDGSLSSEQMAQLSAPPTPVIGQDDDAEKGEDWSGVVQLQPGALATLQALSGDNESVTSHDRDREHEQPDQVLEIPPEPVQEMRQQPLRIFTDVHVRPPQSAESTPASQRRSLADLTKLEIPSPGGFFSGLSPRSRTTWHMPCRSPEEMVPPTSTTAEQFYRAPWNMSLAVPPVPSVAIVAAKPPTVIANIAEHFYRSIASPSPPVEQIVEVIEEEDDVEDDMPTARPVVHTIASSSSPTAVESSSPQTDEAATEIVTVYDPEYARKQQKVALSNLDRTELWLMAQRAYLKPVESDPADKDRDGLETILEAPEELEDPRELATTPKAIEPSPDLSKETRAKKTVRFSLVTTTKVPKCLPSKLLRQESAYYRAFQDYVVRKGSLDVFVHQRPRFETLQAQRVSLREFHRNQLLGKYQLSVVPQSAKKRLSANVARGDDVLIDDPEKLKTEKEQEAMRQVAMSTWHVAATKYLNGGRLISAPVTKRLSRLSRMAPGKNGVARDRARILDLGGQSTCDWAWHCSLQFPNTKIYTVTTKAIRQLSNSNIRGPPNHRQVAVERLSRLPFADAQFDLISARDLHSILKIVGENGEDEWESCLRECMRVLKPGGYLDFSLLDSDIINAGPLGLAKSVEFGFALKTLGYDPSPTKMWMGRLARAGFEEIRRAWMCLPMGEARPAFPKQKPLPALPGLRQSPDGGEVRTVTMEAMVTGSTDAVAGVTGVVGGWSWERWLLRCEMEKVAGELRLSDTVTAGKTMVEAGECLDGVAAIVEEGRTCGAGWRMLSGYARKPKAGTGMIPVQMAL